jgi:hypothetical protein
MNPKQQHFGLGSSRSADVHIFWPNGEETKLDGVAANRSYTLRQTETSQKTSRFESDGLSESLTFHQSPVKSRVVR